MTKEEDAENARKNEIISSCEHDPKRNTSGGTTCTICGAKFAVIMLPRLAPVPIYTDDDLDYTNGIG
jgi:transcription elongation factor Elf1